MCARDTASDLYSVYTLDAADPVSSHGISTLTGLELTLYFDGELDSARDVGSPGSAAFFTALAY
jgi:hypothetical protein